MSGSVVFDVTTRRGRERVREVWTGVRPSTLSADQLEAAHRAGYEIGGDGWFVGRDPREMTRAELEAMGHMAMPMLAVIRAKCLDCCAGSADEVGKCLSMACPSWPYRMNANPMREVSEGRREAGRRLAAQRAANSSAPKSDLTPSVESPPPVPHRVPPDRSDPFKRAGISPTSTRSASTRDGTGSDAPVTATINEVDHHGER